MAYVYKITDVLTPTDDELEQVKKEQEKMLEEERRLFSEGKLDYDPDNVWNGDD